MRAKENRSRRRGFTLIELLIVLAILVSLFAMVLPNVLGRKKKADIDSTLTQIGLFKGALEHYVLDTKAYPTTEQGLGALISKPEGLSETATWEGPYIKVTELPKDPWGHDYHYAYPPTHGSTLDQPDIWSDGPDGAPDTEDDITSWKKTSGA